MYIERFFDTKALVVECTPKRVNCPIGGKSYTLNEGRELGLIEEGLENKDDCWVAQYPWIRDSKRLPENKEFASRKLKATETNVAEDVVVAEKQKEAVNNVNKKEKRESENG